MIRTVLAAACLWSASATADVLPEPAPFDGRCRCELSCGDAVYRVTFRVAATTETLEPQAAHRRCVDGSSVKRGLRSLEADLAPRAMTVRFCRFGGTDVAACGEAATACVDDAIDCQAMQFARS